MNMIIDVMKKMNEILLILLIYFVMNENLFRKKLKEKTIMTHVLGSYYPDRHDKTYQILS